MTHLKVITAATAALMLAACANAGAPRGASSVESAFYSVPVPPYTRTIFSSTNF